MRFGVTKKRLLLLLLVGVFGFAGFAAYAVWFRGGGITEETAKQIQGLNREQLIALLGPPGDYSVFVTTTRDGLVAMPKRFISLATENLRWTSNTGLIDAYLQDGVVVRVSFVPLQPEYTATFRKWFSWERK